MVHDEVIVLLGFMNGIDARVTVNELSVSSWSNILPKSMTLEEGMECAKRHYLNTDKPALPAHIVGIYRLLKEQEPQKPVEKDHDCMNGWVLIKEWDHVAAFREAVTPCKTCQVRSAIG
jgi:hypothetical protein